MFPALQSSSLLSNQEAHEQSLDLIGCMCLHACLHQGCLEPVRWAMMERHECHHEDFRLYPEKGLGSLLQSAPVSL